jgi:hypothetical protein
MTRLLIALLLVAAVPLFSETVQLSPMQDAYICCCKPDSTNPNGGPDYLYHGQFGNCFDRTLIQWDISGIPQGASIVSATMELYCEAFYGTPTGKPVYYMIDGPWDEDNVTFNTQPEYDTVPEIEGTWPAADDWYQLDVTEFVESWFAGSHANYGIYCFCKGTEGTCVPGFWSGDYQEESLRPRLVVEYYPEELCQCTWGFIKRD